MIASYDNEREKIDSPQIVYWKILLDFERATFVEGSRAREMRLIPVNSKCGILTSFSCVM